MKKRYVVEYDAHWMDNPGPLYFRSRVFAYVVGWFVFTLSTKVTGFHVSRLAFPTA